MNGLIAPMHGWMD